jgi:type I restriction enzyme S subunit
VRLSEVSSLIVDSEHKTAPKDPDGLHPLIRTTDLGKARADFRGAQRVSAAIHARWTARAIPSEGDLILAREAPVGGICRVPAEVSPVLGQRTVLVRPDPAAVDSGFLSYRLAAPDLQARLCEMSTGSTVPHLNMSDIRALTISDVPSLNTQRRIAMVLSAFDELIEINERRIEVLEDLARSLYREWFVRFRFPGHEDARFVDSALGAIPEGWQVRRLRDFVSTQYGFTASADDEPVGPRFLRGMDINKRSFVDWSVVPYCKMDEELEAKFKLEVGDVCVIRMANPGRVGIVERPIDAVFASYLVRLRSSEPRVPQYLLFHHLDASEYQSWISGSSTGSTRKSASAGVLTEPQVVVPSQEFAALFDSRIGALRGELTTRVEQSAALAATRDLLLPRLVTGRLDISEIDLSGLLPPEAA